MPMVYSEDKQKEQLKNFQKENGLVADGIVGQKTIAKLLA